MILIAKAIIYIILYWYSPLSLSVSLGQLSQRSESADPSVNRDQWLIGQIIIMYTGHWCLVTSCHAVVHVQ